MKRIRKGIEFTVHWKQLINGLEEDLSAYELNVFLVYPNGRKKEVEYTRQGVCIMRVVILPELQKEFGVYSLEIWLNRNKDKQSVADICNAFELIPTTCYKDEVDEAEGLSVEYIELSDSNLSVGIKGDSAYETWLSLGHSGSEQEFMDWIQKPAVEGATEAIKAAKAAESAVIDVEKSISLANEASDNAEKQANRAYLAAESANSIVNQARPLIESLSKYEDELAKKASFEVLEHINEVNI